MSRLEFVKKLYNGKYCYSDHMTEEELDLIHISSSVENIASDMLGKNKIVFLTGNPGDGKTFIIKALDDIIKAYDVYVKKDVNDITGYDGIIRDILSCYEENRPAIIAVNEYPFIQLCKNMRIVSKDIYDEIIKARNNVITYDVSNQSTGKIVLIDLNERNLLDADCRICGQLIESLISLISEDTEHNEIIEYNIDALSVPEIKNQLLALIQLAAVECEHFAIRDILGAFSFIFTACIMDDYLGQRYYSAIFNGSNQLLRVIQQFDPIYLSSPTLDEQLWNGEITEGWILSIPDKWPHEIDDIEAAVECFKDIKRKYYFENVHGHELLSLQPDEIKKCAELLNDFYSQRKRLKERLIKSINKLFLPSSEDKKQLHIWTTHRYDISIPAAVAVSSKSIESNNLDIQMPRPADWINGLEFVPNHIIMKPQNADKPVLKLDIDFLRTLNAVESGYPVGLLAPQYEQAAAMFLQQLDDNGLAEEKDDGEILIASRTKSYKKLIYIQDNKYGFEEEQ